MEEDRLDLLVIVVSSIGFLTLLKSFFHLLKWVWSMFLRPPKKLKDYGKWAMVTGCTDGIGKALAFELASKGLSLVLVGRNPTKLEATTKEIRERCGGQIGIKSFTVDFAKSSGEEVERKIREGIEGLDVGILINNAGAVNPYPKYFHELDLETESIIRVNLEAATWVSKAVLPGMMKKRKGAIVNIGSGSSVLAPSYALFTVYSSTKAYLAMLSKCMSLEYKKYGIDIQCQIPLFVATKMIHIRKSSFFIPTAEEFSKASIRWIGYDCVCTPYWTHAVQWALVSLVPDAIVSWCLFRYFLILRKRGLRSDSIKLKK
ncbi:hypothetical protein Ancab_021286 [Ancistrocladus abbreviatus]